MSKSAIILLALVLCCSSIFAQSQFSILVDSLALKLAGVSEADSLEVLEDFIIDYGGDPSYRNEILPYCYQLKSLAERFRDDQAQVYCFNSMSYIYGTRREMDSMLHYAHTSLAIARRLDADSMWAHSYQIQAQAQLNLEQFDSAMYYATQSAKYYERLGQQLSLANTYKLISNILSRVNQRATDESIAYSRRALEVCTDDVDPLYRSRFVINLAVDFGLNLQHDSVYHYVQMAIDRGKRLEQPSILASAYHLLSEYYYFTDRYEEALRWVDTVQTHHSQHLSLHQNNNSLFTRSEALFYLGRYDEALKVGEQLMERAEQYGIAYLIRDLAAYMSKVYQQAGRYEEALTMLQLNVQYKDSLYNERQVEIVSELEKKFELAEKEKALAQVEQLQVEQQLQFQRRWSLAVVLVLVALLIAAALFWQSRLRTIRAEKEAGDLQQRLLRSQMNPHFAFNTLGSIQNYLLQSGKSEKASYYLAKFAKLMRQILDQSRASEITLDEELETLTNYLSLQQIRYENKFEYQLNIDPDLDVEATMVPPMLMQPVIENSIEHGKVHTIESGRIAIDIHPEGELLKVHIRDNGLGRKAATISRPEGKPESVATNIIRDRIRLLKRRYGREIDFGVSYPEKGGAEAFFYLPFIRKAL